jgi:DNA replication initiation complex subunit (GINS family)
VSKLSKLTKTCNYGELAESLICDRIICGIIDNTARKRLLQEDKLIFSKVHRHLQSFRVDMCKIENDESAEATDDIKAVRHKSTFYKNKKRKLQMHTKQRNCMYCGKQCTCKGKCPAYDKT